MDTPKRAVSALRPYQREVLELAELGNVIVYLDTGARGAAPRMCAVCGGKLCASGCDGAGVLRTRMARC